MPVKQRGVVLNESVFQDADGSELFVLLPVAVPRCNFRH